MRFFSAVLLAILYEGIVCNGQDKLKVAIYQDNALPFASVAGPPTNWTGFEIDILKEICGSEFQVCEFTLVDSLPDRLSIVQNDTADLSIGSISVTPQREEVVTFIHPFYYSAGSTLYTTAENAATIAAGGWSGISGKPVCTLFGNYDDDLVVSKYGAVLVFADMAGSADRVERGECIAFFGDSGQLDGRLSPVPGLPLLDPRPYGLATNRFGRQAVYEYVSSKMVRLMQAGADSKILDFEKSWMTDMGLSTNPHLADTVDGISTFFTEFVASNRSAAPLNRSDIEKGKLVVAVPATSVYPYVSVMGPQSEWTGFEVELARLLCTLAEATCEFLLVYSLDARLEVVVNGTADFSIGTISVTSPREDVVSFIHPYYYSSGITLFATPTNGESIMMAGGWNGLKGKPICAKAGYYGIDDIVQVTGADVVVVDTSEEAINMAIEGRDCIAYMQDSGFMLEIPQVAGLEPLDTAPYGIAISKEGDAALYDSLASSMVYLMQYGNKSKLIDLEKTWLDIENNDLRQTVDVVTYFSTTVPDTNGTSPTPGPNMSPTIPSPSPFPAPPAPSSGGLPATTCPPAFVLCALLMLLRPICQIW